jgi:hypothetical protein
MLAFDTLPQGMTRDPRSGAMRLTPAMEAAHYTTYGIHVKTRIATCQEFECDYWETGWYLRVDEKTEMGFKQALYLRRASGRRYREDVVEGGLTRFYFYPHQMCFTTHKLPAADERYIRRNGDWRGNPRGEIVTFRGPEDWADDGANHQSRLITAIQRG